MAAATQLISSVGVGIASRYGATNIKNISLSISPKGLAGNKVGSPRVFDALITGGFNNIDIANAVSNKNFRFDFTPTLRPISNPSGIKPPLIPTPKITGSGLPIFTVGISSLVFGANSIVSRFDPYTTLNLSEYGDSNISVQMAWGGSNLLSSVGGLSNGVFGQSLVSIAKANIKPSGIANSNPSNNTLVSKDVLARSVSLDFILTSQSIPSVSLSFGGALLIRAKSFTSSNFARPLVSADLRKVVSAPGINSASIGLNGRVVDAKLKSSINLDFTVVKNQSGSNVAFSFFLENEPNLYPVGIDSLSIGGHGISYKTTYASVVGIESTINVSSPVIYNFHHFALLKGIDSQAYGTAFLGGGVKTVTPMPFDASIFGNQRLLNTTADQYIYAANITPPVMPAPLVSPRMLYTKGVYGTLFGGSVVTTSFEVRQKGSSYFQAGTTTIWYHTRVLAAAGFESYDTGYPKAFIATQFIQPSAFNRTAVFGDIYANNVWLTINNTGAINNEVVSQWAVVENTGRAYSAKGFLSQAIGRQSVQNKSPAIWFVGIAPPTINAPAIGNFARLVSPRGFDLLSLGSGSVVKMPVLEPSGIIGTQFGDQWVSNKTRYIRNSGEDYSGISEPTVWFGFRSIAPLAWQSLGFGADLTLTHGVRELITKGFDQQGYGNEVWVSYGTRLISATSIENEALSTHYVGRHQEIKPFGYIATRFGTRISPNSQSLYAQGFTGTVGQAVAYLKTQYLSPTGYLSAGEQAAFRWGRLTTYNTAQHVTQYFMGDSGLVPPRWSDWTAIENRNKTIGSIGTVMQRFGYAQIGKNARLLEPQSLIATRIGSGMVAYRIRYLPLQGIDPPYMSDWLVAHNAARVIKPAGKMQSLFGNAELVKTRRYLDRIGRIESFEAGVPIVSYRIRTIDIEKRYSIAPPIIRLPTIDLHTRYVEFRGYETAKYGLASLSIHFRIVTPRWSHRNKVSEPALRNLTPELITKGRDSNEYGVAKIRTQWRFINAQGDTATIFGGAKIADTKQGVFVRGWLDSISSQKHIVTKTGTNPYVTQNIWLNNESGDDSDDGYGIFFDEGLLGAQVPTPALNQNVLYASSIDSMVVSEKAKVHSNNLQMTTGIAIDGVSKGASVYVLTQILDLAAAKNIDSMMVVGEPRLSPHTIWAVMDAPAQAIANHPLPVGSVRHYVDSHQDNGGMGHHFIESTIREVRHQSAGSPVSSVVGKPSAYLKKIVLKPNPFRSARFGLPSIPFTLQAITVRLGISSRNLSVATITRPPYVGPQLISAIGLIATRFGSTYSDNFIRNIYPSGMSTQSMGASKPNDNPYMWQGLRVGENVPTSIGAGDTSSHGDTFVSLRIRELGAEGFDAFISRYELESFAGRMTVRNTDQQLPQIRQLNINGIEPNSTVGYQDVKLGQRYIRPDGNSEQFRKGGHHA